MIMTPLNKITHLSGFQQLIRMVYEPIPANTWISVALKKEIDALNVQHVAEISEETKFSCYPKPNK